MANNVVLYNEDNPDNMMLVQRALESRGYKLLQAKNGLDGVAMAEREEINLILLDLEPPGGKGQLQLVEHFLARHYGLVSFFC